MISHWNSLDGNNLILKFFFLIIDFFPWNKTNKGFKWDDTVDAGCSRRAGWPAEAPHQKGSQSEWQAEEWDHCTHSRSWKGGSFHSLTGIPTPGLRQNVFVVKYNGCTVNLKILCFSSSKTCHEWIFFLINSGSLQLNFPNDYLVGSDLYWKRMSN